MEKFVAPFIKSSTLFNGEDYAPSNAPIFRRKFYIEAFGTGILRFCALGYGYCYINGKPASEDLLCAPVSDYNKLVWYQRYDVSHLLKKGENQIAVILGNGFFNENFPSAWDHNKALWRDNPKMALSLEINGDVVLESDEKFLCSNKSFVTYNELRSGETFDVRLYDKRWKDADFDDSAFSFAVIDTKIKAERKLCTCEPIREFDEYDFVSATKTSEGWLLDFGINLSGYLRINVCEKPGTEIIMRHAEEANSDSTLKLNNLDVFYPTVDFQTDRYICGDTPIEWSPKFTYHGFRFVLVSGLTHRPQIGEFKAVFVHQAVERLSSFECSNPLINKIYNAGIQSTFSNLHYALTDCPTREKLGWTNDAQSSLEQIYMNFKINSFMGKWGTDILYSVNENGEMPAIVPSNGWGYGLGPVADGILFELPIIEYLYLGSVEKLISFLPAMKRYYLEYYINPDTDKSRWLVDWDGHNNRFDDKNFVFWFYQIKFCKIMLLAEKMAGNPISERFENDLKTACECIKNSFFDKNGFSKFDSQTVISMLICLKIVDNNKLIEQLKNRIEQDNFHLTSGMLGLQYIYKALFENNAGDYAYRLITATGKPSFSEWFENGATTLWETWENGQTDSRNHHMLSGVIAYFFKGFLGINVDLQHPGFERVLLTPCFVKGLDRCSGVLDTVKGKISASWERKENIVEYTVMIPDGVCAEYDGLKLVSGENVICKKIV